jgi:flagellar export protein FliJ
LRKFTYNLETLLRYREEIEDRERDELRRLTYKFQVEGNVRSELAIKLHETMLDLVSMCADKSADQELNWFHRYLNRLTCEIRESDKRLAQLKSEIEAQKDAVIEASKNRKTLASMKAKKQKDFFVDLERQEQKEIDELVVTRYSRAESGRQISADIQSLKSAAKHE